MSSNIVRQVFRPLVSSAASPLTIENTSVQPHDSDWLSPEAPTVNSRPPQQVPIKRSNTVRKLYSTETTRGNRESFGEYMHDYCYGGNSEYDLLPIISLDPVKHPWDTDLLADLCKIRINGMLRSDKDYVEQWICAIAKVSRTIY